MSESELDRRNENDNRTDPSKPLLLYLDRKKTMDGYERQKLELVFASLTLALIGIVCWNIYPELSAIPLVLLISALAICLFTFSIKLKPFSDFVLSEHPVIEIHPEGIGIHCPYRNFDLIPWRAIKEVKVMRLFSFTSLEIIPKDPEYVLLLESDDPFLANQLGQSSMLSKLIEFNKRWPVDVLPSKPREISIDVPELWLPFSAKEVAELINIRLSKYCTE